MRFFLAAKRTFCVITLYALKIRASFFKARFVANLDDYKCVACCKRVYSCGETIKKHEVSFFLSHPVPTLWHLGSRQKEASVFFYFGFFLAMILKLKNTDASFCPLPRCHSVTENWSRTCSSTTWLRRSGFFSCRTMYKGLRLSKNKLSVRYIKRCKWHSTI